MTTQQQEPIAPVEARPVGEAANPVHMTSGPDTRWTTVNFAEAIQGVQTPLSWGVWNHGMEIACRRAFHRLGVLTAKEAPPPEEADLRMSGIFYGRAAGNINFFRMVGERMPGSSADVIEEKLFGEVSGTPTLGGESGLGRQAIIGAKLPKAAFKAPRALPAILENERTWWREHTIDRPPETLEAAQQLVQEGAEHFANVGVEHTIVSMLGPQLLEALTDLAQQATGEPALGMDLATGFGGMEETQIIADLWAASNGDITVEEIQRRHGFHGPDEGRLDTHSWREDPAPVHAILRGYQQREVADPRQRERERTALRNAAAKRVLDGLPAHKRPAAKLVMKLASVYIPARELGKAAFLHDLDAARCGARVGGRILADRGFLDDPEDVFFLTLEEFTGSPDQSLRERAAERRANHARYEQMILPPTWNGQPAPVEPAGGDDHQVAAGATQLKTELRGIGVVGETVTGRARVIHDPHEAELEPGDILVCVTTDPSWTPLFMLADALVIDTGGAMSHGAIVARELGVTCVINTVTGTKDIPDGATITVDGATGLVRIAV